MKVKGGYKGRALLGQNERSHKERRQRPTLRKEDTEDRGRKPGSEPSPENAFAGTLILKCVASGTVRMVTVSVIQSVLFCYGSSSKLIHYGRKSYESG